MGGWTSTYSSHGLGDSHSNGAAVTLTAAASSDGGGRDLNDGDGLGSGGVQSGGLLTAASLLVAIGIGGLSLSPAS
jgi:hypothetical protein